MASQPNSDGLHLVASSYWVTLTACARNEPSAVLVTAAICGKPGRRQAMVRRGRRGFVVGILQISPAGLGHENHKHDGIMDLDVPSEFSSPYWLIFPVFFCSQKGSFVSSRC